MDVSDQPEPPETRDNACTVRELEASWMSASRAMEANGNSFHDSPGRSTRKLIELSCCGRNKFLSLQERLSESICTNAILLELGLVGAMLVISSVERVVLMKEALYFIWDRANGVDEASAGRVGGRRFLMAGRGTTLGDFRK